MSKQKDSFRIGVDFGGVLYDPIKSPLNITVNEPKAVECLKKLRGEGNELILISAVLKKGSKDFHDALVEKKIDSLFTHEYYVTQMKFKKFICKYIGCHILIDDRIDILNDVKKFIPDIVTIWFKGTSHKTHFTANNWTEILDIIHSVNHFEVVPDSNIDISSFINESF